MPGSRARVYAFGTGGAYSAAGPWLPSGGASYMSGATSDPRIWRKKPQQSRSSNTVHSILQAAEELFAAKGYRATSADDIVQRAGIGVGSLYDYFPNKASIALALLEATSTTIADDSRRLFVQYGKEPLQSSLPKVVRKIFDKYKTHRNILINLVNEVPELRSTSALYAIDQLIHRASLMYLQMYQDEYPGKDIRVTHEFLNLVFTASVRHYLAESAPTLSEDDFLEQLSKTILLSLIQPAPG